MWSQVFVSCPAYELLTCEGLPWAEFCSFQQWFAVSALVFWCSSGLGSFRASCYLQLGWGWAKSLVSNGTGQISSLNGNLQLALQSWLLKPIRGHQTVFSVHYFCYFDQFCCLGWYLVGSPGVFPFLLPFCSPGGLPEQTLLLCVPLSCIICSGMMFVLGKVSKNLFVLLLWLVGDLQLHWLKNS